VIAKSAEHDSEEFIMRSRVIALLVAALGLALVPATAEAGRRGTPHYYPFYHKHYRSDFRFDPYAYEYSPRGYYPYYNSGHWRPTRELRYRRYNYRPYASLPPYYRAWGHPTRYYGYRKPVRRYHHFK